MSRKHITDDDVSLLKFSNVQKIFSAVACTQKEMHFVLTAIGSCFKNEEYSPFFSKRGDEGILFRRRFFGTTSQISD